jgi:hypothetical protein
MTVRLTLGLSLAFVDEDLPNEEDLTPRRKGAKGDERKGADATSALCTSPPDSNADPYLFFADFAPLREISSDSGLGLESGIVDLKSTNGRNETRLPLVPASPHLGRESGGILIEQIFRVDSIAGKRAAAEVVDEKVMGDRQIKPGTAGPRGEIVIVKEIQSKPLVEPPIAS